MDRRTLFTRAFSALLSTKAAEGGTEQNPFANQTLPEALRSNTSLAPYTGAWTREHAAHLLRRTMFGPTKAEIDMVQQMGLQQALNLLFAPEAAPAPPLNSNYATDPDVPVGATWINAPVNPQIDFYRVNSLVNWWMGLMAGQGMSLREKMTLFWHNHFATELTVFREPRRGYYHIAMLRENALGNFKTLVEKVTIDPAMLVYLNGNQNIAGRPNENYARELFELFTVGKGPQIAPGNYTNYTEDDILAASKVLTGWRDRANRNAPFDIYAEFVPNLHDTSTKQFSAAFQNRTLANNGQNEYKDLINMIFAQQETARYICRKLYRWFVYYVIDSDIETQIIEPMAQLLIQNNFEIAPVLRALLESEHFYDVESMGCIIKNPADFVVSLVRQCHVQIPDGATNLAGQYALWNQLVQRMAEQQMTPFDPPSVAGWPAYYQTPVFHEAWISSATLGVRSGYTAIMATTGYRRQGASLVIDPLRLMPDISVPDDPNVLVQELAELFFPRPLEASQLTYLKGALLPGLPDFVWANEYSAYLLDPTDRMKRDAVTNKLSLLLVAMMGLAEYYLS